MSRTVTKSIIVVFMAVVMAMAFMPMMSQNQIYAASKKPATVKITKVSVKGTTVTVKWEESQESEEISGQGGNKDCQDHEQDKCGIQG